MLLCPIIGLAKASKVFLDTSVGPGIKSFMWFDIPSKYLSYEKKANDSCCF
ncbi:protein of unknown function [Candidatus Methylacidiphilum fumarolicum]|uniref:Uncharacterized protein n=1 Tax=Candidatus Methylacidiphilum fumarolicum TaxID=591154 RepID=A0ABN8XD46_9BACT|nr:protein of unknown function [Candidatus Methylacidiphilum fumarolicum]